MVKRWVYRLLMRPRARECLRPYTGTGTIVPIRVAIRVSSPLCLTKTSAPATTKRRPARITRPRAINSSPAPGARRCIDISEVRTSVSADIMLRAEYPAALSPIANVRPACAKPCCCCVAGVRWGGSRAISQGRGREQRERSCRCEERFECHDTQFPWIALRVTGAKPCICKCFAPSGSGSSSCCDCPAVSFFHDWRSRAVFAPGLDRRLQAVDLGVGSASPRPVEIFFAISPQGLLQIFWASWALLIKNAARRTFALGVRQSFRVVHGIIAADRLPPVSVFVSGKARIWIGRMVNCLGHALLGPLRCAASRLA